jgi:diguanylate cyclase (GGDEF)-like protein
VAALEARADIDPLTNLPNRRAFERELARSLAYLKRHGNSAVLLYLDLDDFKHINDDHGHAAGDDMLRAVARVLGRHVRESDVVSRIGGDEFALLLWNCDEAHAVTKAVALEAAIGRTTAAHGGAMLAVGASVGLRRCCRLTGRPTPSIGPIRRCMRARRRGGSATASWSPAAVNLETAGTVISAKYRRFYRAGAYLPHLQSAADRLSEGQGVCPCEGDFRC